MKKNTRRRSNCVGRLSAAVAACFALGGGCTDEGHFNCGPEAHPERPARVSAKQLALMVGINDYKYGEVADLEGAVGDVARMRAVLMQRYGYRSEDIRVLTDHEATLHNILKAFRQHLVEQAEADTVALFYFSGHGSQMVDTSGDESDGKDETLVAYDSGRVGDHPNRDLSDDVLNRLFADLGKRTDHAMGIFDSCNSGAAARGAGRPKTVPSDERGRTRALPRARGVREGGSGYDPKTQKYVLISAAQSGEFANETTIGGVSTGALTWALTNALWKADEDETYRDVMDRVKAEVTARFPRQHPQLEGYRDKLLFGRQRLKPKPYAIVLKGRKGFELGIGQAQGLQTGAIFGVYPPNTKHFTRDRKIGELEVTKVHAARAETRLMTEGAEIPDGARAVPLGALYAPTKLRVSLLEAELFETLQQIKKRLDDYQHIETTTSELKYDLLLRQNHNRQIITEAGSPEPVSDPIPVGPDAAERVVEQVLGWAKWFSVEGIHGPTHLLDVELRLEPAQKKGPGGLPGGYFDLRVEAGDTLDIVVRNKSPYELYMSVVLLSSDGSIAVAYPPSGANETIAKGSVWRRPVETCLPPGWKGSVRDVYKLFVTRAPADFSVLEQPPIKRGERRRTRGASTHPLTDLLAQGALGASARGGQPPRATLAADAWATRVRAVEVLPRADGERHDCVGE